LQRAGFHVTGVDIEPQPRYCGDAFIQADALTFPLEGYALAWAGPMCQEYTQLNLMHKKSYPTQLLEIRARLRAAGVSYVIENVPGAPLHNPVMLCGSQFGLKVYRHRLFESNLLLLTPPHVPHDDNCPAVGRGMSRKGFISVTGTGGFGFPDGHEYARKAMGIDWMTRAELSQAIPPAYSEFLGRQVMAYLIEQRERAA
jgi:DNA (cytosine-5)-methyltransferase 1